jgi:hypothetical protein
MMHKMKSGGMAKDGKKSDFMKMIADKKAKKDGPEDKMGADKKQDKTMAKKAVGMHERQLHGGKKSNLAKLKSGGSIDGCAVRGKTKTTMVKMAMGGKTKKAC